MPMPHNRSLIETQWQTQPVQTRVLVFHPLGRQRYYVVGEAIDSGGVYRRLAHGDSAASLTAWFQDIVATQGRITSRRDLVLDECDRAEPEGLLEFVRSVVETQARWRIILVTRVTPHLLFTDPVLRPVMRYIPCVDGVPRWDHMPRLVDRPWLEVNALGRGHVFIDGREVNDWAGALPRNLFFYMIEQGIMRRKDIFATFWPDLPDREATNVFHVTKHKIAQMLGLSDKAGSKRSFTRWDGDYYHISPELQLDYDAREFTTLYDESQVASGEEAIELLEYALSLYRNTFLTGLNAEWAARRRGALHEMYGDMLALLGETCLAVGDEGRAYGAFLRASAHDHAREDVVVRVMALARQYQTPHEGVRVYERLAAVRAANGTPAPIDPNTTALYEELRQQAM